MVTRILAVSATLLLIAGCGGPRAHSKDWPDRTPQQRGQLDGYKPVGRWQTFHPDGSLASEGDFLDGRQEGRWSYALSGGIPAGTGHWRGGVQHGWWTSYAPDSSLRSAGLMWQGRRVGPWLVDGAVRTHGGETTTTVDTIAWQQRGDAAVSWLVGAATVAVEASWTGSGSPWHERFTAPAVRDGLAAALPGAAEPPAPVVATTPSAPALPEAEIPAEAGVELTPVPPLITYGGVVTWLADGIREDFTGTLPPAGLAPAPPVSAPVAQGDPSAQALIGRPLPQTRFLSSTGGVIDLAKPARPTAVIIMRGFSGSVCLYCASQTAALADAAGTFAAAGVDIVVIYPGPASSIPGFINAVQQLRKDPPPMPVALDVNLLLVSGLGINAELAKPTSLVLRTDGTIAWAYIGTSMSDRPTAADIIAAAQVSQVAAAAQP